MAMPYTVAHTDPTVLVVSDLTGAGHPVAAWLEACNMRCRPLPSSDLGRHGGAEADAVVVHIDKTGREAATIIASTVRNFPDAAIVVVCEVDDEAACIAALTAGAQEYLMGQGLDGPTVGRALERARARRQAESRFNGVSAALAEANAELCDFAHIVAHDLRAPVRTAHLFGERLVATANLEGPGSKEIAHRLLESLARVDRIIISMLDYTSLRTELPEPLPVNAYSVAVASAKAVGRALELDPDAISIDIPGDLAVLTSSFHLGKVLEQVLANAAQYRAASPVAIQLTGCVASDRARLRIVDNGIGVPSDARERVFQPMERLATDRSGPGLGLAIARRIVNGYGGSIWIEPGRVQGTAVSIDLPTG